MTARSGSDAHGATDSSPAANVNTLWARVLVDELVRCGLRHAVIAPGSRSAPLVFQFAERREIDDRSIIDERSAAFFALGMARSLGMPVALLCTSGTAAANFYPAVCEAGADDVPLIVLTGDRPVEDHDCGAQQVMDQRELYGNQVRMFHQLAQPEADSRKLAYLRTTACRAWHSATGPRAGPVHLDLPFDKPLEPVNALAGDRGHLGPDALRFDAPAVAGRPEGRPYLARTQLSAGFDPGDLERIAERIDGSQRPILLAGADRRGPSYRQALRRFAERAGIPVLAEAASGLRHWDARGDHVIGSFELLAEAGSVAELEADLVLRIGHPPLTWAAQRWLSERTGAYHLQVDRGGRILDPDRRLDEHIVGDPAAIFEALGQHVAPASAGRRSRVAALRSADRAAAEELGRALTEQDALTAPRLWHELGRLLPEDAALYFSSSMLVRHLETFMCAHRNTLAVHFNRGLNGIDGVVSTAAGIAAARRASIGPDAAPTVLVIGDVALRHDVAALLIAIEQCLDLTVVIVDNGGGEIFEYLPSANFGGIHEKHFATSESLSIAEILPRAVEMHEPADWGAFGCCITASLARPGLKVVRVATDRRADRAHRSRLMQRAADALARQFAAR